MQGYGQHSGGDGDEEGGGWRGSADDHGVQEEKGMAGARAAARRAKESFPQTRGCFKLQAHLIFPLLCGSFAPARRSKKV